MASSQNHNKSPFSMSGLFGGRSTGERESPFSLKRMFGGSTTRNEVHQKSMDETSLEHMMKERDVALANRNAAKKRKDAYGKELAILMRQKKLLSVKLTGTISKRERETALAHIERLDQQIGQVSPKFRAASTAFHGVDRAYINLATLCEQMETRHILLSTKKAVERSREISDRLAETYSDDMADMATDMQAAADISEGISNATTALGFAGASARQELTAEEEKELMGELQQYCTSEEMDEIRREEERLEEELEEQTVASLLDSAPKPFGRLGSSLKTHRAEIERYDEQTPEGGISPTQTKSKKLAASKAEVTDSEEKLAQEISSLFV